MRDKPLGIPLDLWGETIYLVPIEVGPLGHEKRKALRAILEAPDDIPEDQGLELVKAFYKTLLVQNYSEQEAEELAGKVPEGWAEAMMTLARKATLPANFMGRPTQAPGGKA